MRKNYDHTLANVHEACGFTVEEIKELNCKADKLMEMLKDTNRPKTSQDAEAFEIVFGKMPIRYLCSVANFFYQQSVKQLMMESATKALLAGIMGKKQEMGEEIVPEKLCQNCQIVDICEVKGHGQASACQRNQEAMNEKAN